MNDPNSKYIDSRLGIFVRRSRKELGWTQAELAATTEISQGYISQIESSSRKSMSTLGKLRSLALGLGYDGLGAMIQEVEQLPPEDVIIQELEVRYSEN